MYNDKLSCFAQDNALDSVHCLVNAVNGPLWDWLVVILLGVGLFFTVTTGFVQLRLFRQSIREIEAVAKTQTTHMGLQHSKRL